MQINVPPINWKKSYFHTNAATVKVQISRHDQTVIGGSYDSGAKILERAIFCRFDVTNANRIRVSAS
jgi:hypothetical protein